MQAAFDPDAAASTPAATVRRGMNARGVDDDELAACVACGLCLPHCPTYRVTGEEAASPRGRIAAMREVEWDGAPLDDAFVGFMDACVQCRGCETACPSGVPFGRLMEGTRDSLAAARSAHAVVAAARLTALGHHRLLLAGSTCAGRRAAARLVPRRVACGSAPAAAAAARRRCEPTGDDVWLFTGCVMDAWQRAVHAAAQPGARRRRRRRRAARAGAATAAARCTSTPGSPTTRARLAERVMASMPGDAPIVVDSAGCGAALKDYGHLLGTPEAARVQRPACATSTSGSRRASTRCRGPPSRASDAVVVQDPCHLRHVQRAHLPVRTVLRPYVDARRARRRGPVLRRRRRVRRAAPRDGGRDPRAQGRGDRPVAAPTVVASANPGCALHLAAAGVDVRHPMELIDDALEASCDGR